MIRLLDALESIYTDCSVAIENEKIFHWKDERPQPSEEEIQAKIQELEAVEPLRLLRIQRNQILQQSDWRDLPSYPGTDQEEWRTYRQALRDLTTTSSPEINSNGELINVKWPTAPGEQ